MGLLQDIQKKIRAKESEIADIEEEVRNLHVRKEAAKAYISGLQDILPRVQRDEGGGGSVTSVDFRKGSQPEIVKALLQKAGTPLHVDVMLERMGKSGDKKAKLALVGTLARYARQGMAFKKTAPNTYALIGMDVQAQETSQEADASEETSDELPAGFGR
jgi:hypothetical protein